MPKYEEVTFTDQLEKQEPGDEVNAPFIENNNTEVIVTRDFNKEIKVLEDKFNEFIQKERELWSWEKYEYSEEYYRLEKEVIDSIPSFDGEGSREVCKIAYARSFIEHKDAILNVWKDLEVFQKDVSLVTPENCVGIATKAWDCIEGLRVTYDDFPSEDTEYRIIMNEVFQQTVRVVSNSCRDLSHEQKDEVCLKLKNIAIENSVYNTWYFDRIEKIAEVLVDVNGVKELNSAHDIVEKLEKDSQRQYKEWFEDLKLTIDEDRRRLEDMKANPEHWIGVCWGGEKGYKKEIKELEKSLTDNDFALKNESYYDEDFRIDKGYLEFDYNDHYHMHTNFVDFLASKNWSEAEKPEVAKFLCHFMEKQSAGSLRAYVNAFQALGFESSLNPLLQNLKNESVLAQRMSAEILFNLELGRVGVSEQGVQYLGKLYDLGKYNDPDFFVRRLNSSGLMALLRKEGSIEGVFPLELFADSNVVQAEVRQLLSQDLFLPKADETPQQRSQREEYLALFLKNSENIYNDEFFKGVGVRLNSLDLHEQGWFILYYLNLSNQENVAGLEKLRNFVQKYGGYGLKSFLALEYGGSGEEILDFAETPEISLQDKYAIFKNFYAIANEAANWREVFGRVEEETRHEFAAQVQEAFIRKNAEFFKSAQIIARGEGGEVTMSELIKNMNTIAFSLRALKGVYEKDSGLELEQKPQTQDEYDINGNLIEESTSSYIFLDKKRGARIAISIRPRPTVKRGEMSGGEARINFKVTDMKTREEARVGFDLSNRDNQESEGKGSAISLDLGVGKLDREAGIWPTKRIGRVLELVQGSEGGHNELSFKPEVAEQFPQIAEKFKEYIEFKFVR